MDPIRNPYTPGAGTRPDELAGRDEEIQNFRVLLSRLLDGRPEQSQIITGLRGVGKTVLLNAFEDYSEEAGYLSAFHELTPESSLPELMPSGYSAFRASAHCRQQTRARRLSFQPSERAQRTTRPPSS